jgi:hypothetical protein
MNELMRSQLDAYLDGTMAEPERLAFQRLLETDANLNAVVQRQQAIDHSLRRLFPVSAQPSVQAVLQLAQLDGQTDSNDEQEAKPATAAQPRRGSWLRKLAIAAALLIGAYGAWTSYEFYFPPEQHFTGGQSGGVEQLSIDDYYAIKIKSGYQPYWLCEDDAEFAETFRSRFGQALLLRPLPENITCAGLDYCYTVSENTTAVMLVVDGEEIIVLVDSATQSSNCGAKPVSDLNTFETTVGKLKLIEVSPLDEPKTLELFFNPDATSS